MRALNKFFLVTLSVLMIPCYIFSQWVLQNSGTTTALLDIDYVSSQNGGLVIACGSNGNVYRSSNGGANWTQISTGSAVSLSVIEFTDINTGYAAGSSGKIIKTINGGLNWTVISTDTTNNYSCIFFVNSSTGYICGSGTASAVILKTTNNGINWSSSAITTQSNQLQSIFFIDPSSGWAAGYNGTSFIGSILKTTNGGSSWQDVLVSAQVELFIDIFMLNSSTGFAASSINISKTTNGGINLSPSFVPANTQLDLEFINASTGYSCGAPGLVYKTTNNGLNWFQQTAPGGSIPLRTVSMIGDTGFICGANGTILKTTNGGQIPTGVQNFNNEIPERNFLEQNYPNPFNPNTSIKFNVVTADNITIKVYDITGKEVLTVVKEHLLPGIYYADIDASGLVSGIYFYRLQAGTFTDTKKMILLK